MYTGRMVSHRRHVPFSLLCMLVFAACAWPLSARASDPCNPPNVLPQSVCDFDGWHGDPPRQVADGWTEFVVSGNPDFYRDEHSFFGGGTQTIRSGSPFHAGIWTQAQVTAGAGYRASISWGAPNLPGEFGRQLGLDPTGGTDPNAPTVVWGPMHFGDGRILNYTSDGPNIDVRARAVGDRMTLFFNVDRPTSSGDGLIFIDAIALYPDESAPQAIVVPTETPTAEPPTPEPAPPVEANADPSAGIAAAQIAPAIIVPPDTPTPLPTYTPTAAPTPTSSPTPSPTPSPTATQTPTLTPTWTPWPTAFQPGLFGGGISPRAATAAAETSPATLATLSAVSFLGAALFAGSLVWLRRRR